MGKQFSLFSLLNFFTYFIKLNFFRCNELLQSHIVKVTYITPSPLCGKKIKRQSVAIVELKPPSNDCEPFEQNQGVTNGFNSLDTRRSEDVVLLMMMMMIAVAMILTVPRQDVI